MAPSAHLSPLMPVRISVTTPPPTFTNWTVVQPESPSQSTGSAPYFEGKVSQSISPSGKSLSRPSPSGAVGGFGGGAATGVADGTLEVEVGFVEAATEDFSKNCAPPPTLGGQI